MNVNIKLEVKWKTTMNIQRRVIVHSTRDNIMRAFTTYACMCVCMDVWMGVRREIGPCTQVLDHSRGISPEVTKQYVLSVQVWWELSSR